MNEGQRLTPCILIALSALAATHTCRAQDFTLTKIIEYPERLPFPLQQGGPMPFPGVFKMAITAQGRILFMSGQAGVGALFDATGPSDIRNLITDGALLPGGGLNYESQLGDLFVGPDGTAATQWLLHGFGSSEYGSLQIVSPAGIVTMVAREGAPAPLAGPGFVYANGISYPFIDAAGDVYFIASTHTSTVGRSILVAGTNSTDLRLLFSEGDPGPPPLGGQLSFGYTESFAPEPDGSIVLDSFITNSQVSGEAIVRRAPDGATTALIDAAAPVPGSPQHWSTFWNVWPHPDGTLVFASLDDLSRGYWRFGPGGNNLILLGDHVYEDGLQWSFSWPHAPNAAGQLLLPMTRGGSGGRLVDAVRLWSPDGSIILIAKSGDPVLGAPGWELSDRSSSGDDGSRPMTAFLNRSGHALITASVRQTGSSVIRSMLLGYGRARGLFPIVKTGDVYVDESGSHVIGSFSAVLNDSGQFALDLAADGSGWAILLAGQLAAQCGSADFDHDGDVATDQDIEAFFACLAGGCCPTCGSADFNDDGDVGTDADIEAFFRVLAGGSC